MVASSRVIFVTNSRGGVGSSSTTGIDDILLARGDTALSSKPTSSVIRSDIPSKIHLNSRMEPAVASVNIPQRIIKAETQRTCLPSNVGSKNLRRARSDNLAQSKRDDSSVRRSIFGHYFKQKPRSYSAPHLERGQAPPLLPNLQQQFPKRSYKRSSSSPSDSSSSFAPRKNDDPLNDDGSHRHHNHDHPSRQVLDYRVFAPSEQQVAESAICCRYRELNREHQKDYDSLLERQIQVEHSLPPFPSPLIRFCSDTTATVAGSGSYSSFKNSRNPSSRRGSGSYFPSSDGEMHYHGVYSLLTPRSILRPSSYTNKIATTANNFSKESSAPTIDSNNDIPTQTEIEELNHHLSAPLSSSFNFPRSYIENSAILKNFASIGLEGQEEKKENYDIFINASCTKDSMLLSVRNKVISGDLSSTTNTTTITSDDVDRNDCCDNNLRDRTIVPQDLQQDRRLRFDPRVTVTEFEDPIPRNWYNEIELNEHKGEAIALAQSYLREHPAVAGWYRRAIRDPITKTYRKRALFSLPVFSSTYSSSDTDPSLAINNSGQGETETSYFQSSSQQDEQLTLSVKKILIVHPNPAIASLFCKSMKSMFPSAELITTGSTEEASQLIKQSFTPNTGSSSISSTGTASFDIIIIEQRLTSQGTSLNANNNDNKLNGILNNLEKGPLGLLGILMKKNQEESVAAMPSTSCDIRYGSDLIHQVCELSSRKQQQQSRCSAISSCLIIGVSVRPERDAGVMKQAGADIVWGIPIPRVGDTLRNKLSTKLLAKRSSISSNDRQ